MTIDGLEQVAVAARLDLRDAPKATEVPVRLRRPEPAHFRLRATRQNVEI